MLEDGTLPLDKIARFLDLPIKIVEQVANNLRLVKTMAVLYMILESRRS